jgi:hypothetical protein
MTTAPATDASRMSVDNAWMSGVTPRFTEA